MLTVSDFCYYNGACSMLTEFVVPAKRILGTYCWSSIRTSVCLLECLHSCDLSTGQDLLLWGFGGHRQMAPPPLPHNGCCVNTVSRTQPTNECLVYSLDQNEPIRNLLNSAKEATGRLLEAKYRRNRNLR